MPLQTKKISKEIGWATLWVAALLFGLPALCILLVIIAGFFKIDIMLAIYILWAYIQIPAQFLDSSHVEPKLHTPITLIGWLSIPGFYLLLSLLAGIVIGSINSIRKK